MTEQSSVSDDELRNRVGEVLAAVLDRPVGATESLRQADIDEWDSLRHMELVLTLEDEFGVQFEESEFSELDTTDAIVAVLRRRVAEG